MLATVAEGVGLPFEALAIGDPGSSLETYNVGRHISVITPVDTWAGANVY